MLEKSLINFSQKGGSIFFYKGNFENRPSLKILNIVEENIIDKFHKKTKRKTLFFIIEILQNIEKYSEHLEDINDWCFIADTNNKLKIYSQNVISNSKIDRLKEKLTFISNSTAEEIKNLYFSTLTKSLEVDKKSPGLGFIELKRKNDLPFDYSFTKIDDNFSFFNLDISIQLENENPSLEQESDIIKNELISKNHISLYAGDFNGAAASSFNSLVGKLNLSDNKTVSSKYQHAIIEMVQNAKRHGVAVDNRKNGFFYIEEKDNKIETVCCNQTNDTTSLIKSIDELNKCSLEELKIKSRESLLNFEVSGGLGLIQLAMFSHPSPLFSKIISTSKNINFLYIGVLFQTSEQ